MQADLKVGTTYRDRDVPLWSIRRQFRHAASCTAYRADLKVGTTSSHVRSADLQLILGRSADLQLILGRSADLQVILGRSADLQVGAGT